MDLAQMTPGGADKVSKISNDTRSALNGLLANGQNLARRSRYNSPRTSVWPAQLLTTPDAQR